VEVKRRKPFWKDAEELALKKAAAKVARPRTLTRGSIRRAVILAELLGPPVAMRRDYRLF
jgi:hypothetical protein